METIVNARSALLQALVLPGYGSELIERARRLTEGRVRLSMGSLYPALRRLEQEGLLRSRAIRAGGRAGRPRGYCELTARGIEVRNAERRALAGLVGIGEDRRPGAPGEVVAERLRRCSQVSASASRLRRAVAAGRAGR